MAVDAQPSSGTGAPGGELGTGENPASSFNPQCPWVIRAGLPPAPNPETQEGWEELMG